MSLQANVAVCWLYPLNNTGVSPATNVQVDARQKLMAEKRGLGHNSKMLEATVSILEDKLRVCKSDLADVGVEMSKLSQVRSTILFRRFWYLGLFFAFGPWSQCGGFLGRAVMGYG